jgi:Protease inhibitor Inh
MADFRNHCFRKFWRNGRSAISAALVVFLFAALPGCASNQPQPEPAAAPPPPPPPTPPPVELGGRWKLSQVGAGGCFMTFGSGAGADQGTIAPEGGCPGKFFTSRKWTFEHSALIIRDHKGEPLAQLSFANGRFNGQANGGAELVLSR